MSTAPQAYYQAPQHVLAAGIAFSVIDVVFVGLRFWTRRKQNQSLKVDDWLIVPAMLLTIAFSVLTMYGVSEKAVGYRTAIPPDFHGNPLTLETDQLALLARIEFGGTLMLPIALGCTKMSFLAFYHRIFAVNKKSAISWMLQGLMGFITLWMLVFFFMSLFECGTKWWAIWGPTIDMINECVKTMEVVFAFCLSDFLTDVLIIIIPIPLIWRLKLSRPKKLATSAVFLLGGVTIAASLCRLIFTGMAVSRGFNPNEDEVLTITLYLYWSMVECGVGVFAACLPTISFLLKPLPWDTIVSKTRSIFSSQKSQNYSSNGSLREMKDVDTDSSRSTDLPRRGTVTFADDRGNSSDEPILDDVESAISGFSRGSNRLNGDPNNVDSYTTDSSWRTRVPSEGENRLHPPPVAHHMKDLRAMSERSSPV